MTAIALNFVSLGLGPLRGLSLGDLALIIAWTLILIVYVAGQVSRFARRRRVIRLIRWMSYDGDNSGALRAKE